MLQVACTTVELRELPSCESIISPHQTIATPVGPIYLRHRCSSSLVESLRVDRGLCAFARLPEREHALLLGLARRSDSRLALAYTPAGEIVGQVTLTPADAWWEGLANTYEIAVEASSGWRKLGIARQLLALVFAQEALERHIILGMGLSWHWDTEGLGINRFRYRELVKQLFAPYDFVEYLTSEANIRMDPANILLVRLGRDVDHETLNHFFHRLLQSDTLPGL